MKPGEFKLNTIVSAMRLAVAEWQQERRITMLVQHYWPQRHNPDARFYLRHQLKRLRALRKGL